MKLKVGDKVRFNNKWLEVFTNIYGKYDRYDENKDIVLTIKEIEETEDKDKILFDNKFSIWLDKAGRACNSAEELEFYSPFEYAEQEIYCNCLAPIVKHIIISFDAEYDFCELCKKEKR